MAFPGAEDVDQGAIRELLKQRLPPYFVAASPALHQALAPFEETCAGLPLTNMDGHGPMGL
jgi:hypothetical protein